MSRIEKQFHTGVHESLFNLGFLERTDSEVRTLLEQTKRRLQPFAVCQRPLEQLENLGDVEGACAGVTSWVAEPE